ncbi:uncharacterized protein BN781_01208 [Coprococcus sp. CAG:782]|nr:uncharacterized protein BN781_01208 [Coprococcus sp. CAG:782]
MRKKVIIISCVILGILLIVTGVYVLPRLLRKFPDKAAYATRSACYSYDGLYYMKADRLYFFDANTQKSAVVCSKANCNHDSEDCNAYIEGANMFMYYDGYVYVSSFVVDVNSDNGEVEYNGGVSLDSISSDGSKRVNIYSADSGAVLSVKAIDGDIYFTAYKFRNEKDFTDPIHDNYLYKYDLRWNKSTCLYEHNADSEGEDSSALEIAEGDSKDIYILHSWCTDNSNLESDSYVDLFKLEDDQMKLMDSWENVDRIRIMDNEEKGIIVVNEQGEDAATLIYEFKNGKIGETELMRELRGVAYRMHGYLSVVDTDYKKLLYDIKNNKYYIANTTFTEEGTYISDILDIDEEHNRIYIDNHDYTGMLPGTVYYEDLSDQGMADFDVFRDTFYTELDDLTDEQRKQLDAMDWIVIG